MHAHEHVVALVPLAFAKHQMGKSIVELRVGNQVEVAPLRRQFHLLLLTDEGFGFDTIGDEILNGDNFNAVAFSDLHQLGHASHGTVGVDDFDERTDGLQACQLRQVNGGFGMAGTHQHTAVAGTQRVDMTRAAEVLRTVPRLRQRLDGGGTVVHGNACGTAMSQQVHRHREGRAQQRGVVVDLHLQVQLTAAFGTHRCTQHSTTVLHHEIHLLRCNLLSCNNKIAFIFAIFVIHHNQEFAFSEILNRLFYRIEFYLHKYLIINRLVKNDQLELMSH